MSKDSGNVPNCLNCQWMGYPDRKKWVMYGASGTYMIGDFDGETFTLQSGKHQYHKSVMYAAQTYNNSPDGRRIQIGWGRAAGTGYAVQPDDDLSDAIVAAHDSSRHSAFLRARTGN
ncbi:MAG: hypothetical protein U5R06_05200 [candidate division KSB1 bacterium]|nr:hypothetical protein [candidate division KSB1 bacterium]